MADFLASPRTRKELRAAGFICIETAESYGHPLQMIQDTGGDRWYIASRPLRAGDALELLTWSRTAYASDASEDQPEKWGEPLWIRVSFEYQNRHGKGSICLLYPNIAGLWNEPNNAITLDQVKACNVTVRSIGERS